jgi:hypothetical protein
LLGTAIGILPEAIPFTLVASGLVKLNNQSTPLYIGAAIGILVLVCASLWYFSRHSKLLAELRGATQAIHPGDPESFVCPEKNFLRLEAKTGGGHERKSA